MCFVLYSCSVVRPIPRPKLWHRIHSILLDPKSFWLPYAAAFLSIQVFRFFSNLFPIWYNSMTMCSKCSLLNKCLTLEPSTQHLKEASLGMSVEVLHIILRQNGISLSRSFKNRSPCFYSSITFSLHWTAYYTQLCSQSLIPPIH